MRGGAMPELLDIAVEAHGGRDRWNEISAVEIAVSITGAIWYVKSQPNVLEKIVMVVDTRRERVTTSFVGQDRRTVFEPDRVVIESGDGSSSEVMTIRSSLLRARNSRRRGPPSMWPTSAVRHSGRI
jgi:hypothetical protein